MEENENTDNTSLNSFYSFENKKKYENKIYYNGYYISKTLKLISDLLNDICKEDKKNKEDKKLLIKPFISKKIPAISIFEYIERLSKYSKVSDEVFIFVLIYIDRICGIYKINLNYYNIHKLIIASFIVSIKYHEDEYYSIDFYAKIGGIPKKEMINLEYTFLNLIQFNLFVKEEIFNKYNNSLKNLEDDDDCDK